MKHRIFTAAILLTALLAFSSCGQTLPEESSSPTSSASSLPAESSGESSGESSQEESQTETVRWGGVYASEDGGVLTIEMMDNNSFEFTLTAGEDVLESQVARITDPGQAAYTGKDGVRLNFAYLDGTIRVTAEDSTGAEFEGEYSAER